jgi:hypothetical protein
MVGVGDCESVKCVLTTCKIYMFPTQLSSANNTFYSFYIATECFRREKGILTIGVFIFERDSEKFCAADVKFGLVELG